MIPIERNKKLIEELKKSKIKFLEEIKLSPRSIRKHSKEANVFRVEWTKKEDVKKIVDFLYLYKSNKNKIFMKRKYKKASIYFPGEVQ